jgi:glycosyltransferase involved in cell wall biosynthesis
MKKNTHPLVSCICLTNNRPGLLKRSIDCFNGQTYPNRELVLVFRNDDIPTKEYLLSNAGNKAIKCVEVDASDNLSLGMLRNAGIEYSDGEYFCQWDDDDWCHRDRLALQMKAVLHNHKEACVLLAWFYYDAPCNQAYLSQINPWPGSILCKKTLWAQIGGYKDMGRDEDAFFLGRLLKINCIYPLLLPYLYIYVCHGGNTCSREHFDTLFRYSQKMTGIVSDNFRRILDGGINYQEASDLIQSADILQQVNYFHQIMQQQKKGQAGAVNPS